MGACTIGFLGHFAYTERICDYMDTLILRTLQQHGEVRVMVTLRREADRLMAGRVLEIGNLLPGLRLVPVITEQEERIYKKNSPSQSARERKRRLDVADGYEVVPDTLSSNKLPGYHQRFIERCDQIVYSTFRVPQYIRDDFARKVCMKKGRQPLVRYIMEGFSVSAPVSMEPMLDLHQSIEYIRRSGFRVMTDKLRRSCSTSGSQMPTCRAISWSSECRRNLQTCSADEIRTKRITCFTRSSRRLISSTTVC